MTRTVTVTAPSRLHFGLLGFGDASPRQFGGVGAMIDRPALQLRITLADSASFHGPTSERAEHFCQQWSDFHHLRHPPKCRVDVICAPRSHVGLGSGTQLGLAVAAGLNRLYGREASIVETACSVRRGLRSAVGTYGFFQGGLIWERGKQRDQTISPLEQRLAIPDAWRFVVICPTQQAGLSGEGEQTALDSLPPVSVDAQHALTVIVQDRMLPALSRRNCDAFGEAVFDYGRRSGEAFAAIQGGAYNGPRLEHLVARIRELGVCGVGQSSWGPALYVIMPNDDNASQLVSQLERAGELDDADVWVARPDNRGARIAVQMDETKETERP